jgi:hypothetical protein
MPPPLRQAGIAGLVDLLRRRRDEAALARTAAAARPPLVSAGEPWGGSGSLGDIGAAIEAAQAQPPLLAAQGPAPITLPSAPAAQPVPWRTAVPAAAAAVGPLLQQAFSAPPIRVETPAATAPAIRLRRREFQPLAWSGRDLKRDVSRADDRRTLREVMSAPVSRYRYADEPRGGTRRVGPIAEETPARWQAGGGTMVRMPVMIGSMLGAIRALSRDVDTLKARLGRR